MNVRISVIIPNFNGGAFIAKCLEAVFLSSHKNFEVVVVDDCSKDNSVDTIRKFPCRLVRLESRCGTSTARNTGARASLSDILFFIDADCLVGKDTLLNVDAAIGDCADIVIGGTYTPLPYDRDFFSTFQSIFINYFEGRKSEPDYIAGHAMVIPRSLFEQNGGFPEKFHPLIEDVEFSHRLRRQGYSLIMDPSILVTHIFRFNFRKSLRNAFRKSKYWVAYSLGNRDLFSDSGTASIELKTDVVCWGCMLLLCLAGLAEPAFFPLVFALQALNLLVNRGLLTAFYRARGLFFSLAAGFYYTLIYPVGVTAGTLSGIWCYAKEIVKKR